MNLLTLSKGIVVKIKSKSEIENLGEGFVGIDEYEGAYGIIDSICTDTGCYYIKDFRYGWDDRLVTKVENPIAICVVEFDGEIAITRYCDKDDEETKKRILEDLQYDMHQYRKIEIEELLIKA